MLNTFTLSDVPAGIVTSRKVGTGGATASGAGDAADADGVPAAGVAGGAAMLTGGAAATWGANCRPAVPCTGVVAGDVTGLRLAAALAVGHSAGVVPMLLLVWAPRPDVVLFANTLLR